jgi:hypothetical protein
MSFRPPPATACWQHRGARSGFEVAYFSAREPGWHIEVDASWATRSALITARTSAGTRETLLESDGVGRLDPQARVDAPAAYVRALTLTAERLDQVYERIGAEHRQYDYAAPSFGFTARLAYDDSGLVIDYPGIAVRAG